MSEAIAITAITDEHREFAANALHGLPFAKLMGMRLVDLQLDQAVIKIEIRTRLPMETATATIDLTDHYLRPHVEGTATCTAKIVRAGKRIFTVSADVVNDQGKLIATGISTYTKVP